MTGIGENRVRGTFFDQPARVKHPDAPAHTSHQPQVVADQKDADTELLAERDDQVQHLRLYRRIEAGRRLVENQ